MVIDFHTHCFPDKLAERAMASLSHASGMLPATDGTVSGLERCMDEDGVDISVVLGIATNERQQRAVNDFSASISGERIIGFGSVYPDAPDALEELSRIKELGLKGVKFHPEYQHFYVDDEKMKPIYKRISELGLITLFHAGWDVGYKPPYHCMPEHLEKAIGWFDSTVIAAHWGGVSCGIEVIKRLCGRDVYFDTAFGYANIPKPVAMEIVEKHGIDKILFGSDCPWHRPSMEKVLIGSMELTEEEQNKIYYKNAMRILGI